MIKHITSETITNH